MTSALAPSTCMPSRSTGHGIGPDVRRRSAPGVWLVPVGLPNQRASTKHSPSGCAMRNAISIHGYKGSDLTLSALVTYRDPIIECKSISTPCIDVVRMLPTIGFFTRRISEYILQEILGDNNDRLSSGNDAIPAGNGSRSRILIFVKCEPTRQLPYPDLRRLLKGLKATSCHNLPNRTIRRCQACHDCGR